MVSDLGVYEKDGESDALRLSGLLGYKPEAAAVAAARAACGRDLQVAPQLRRFAPPTADELGLIRLFDHATRALASSWAKRSSPCSSTRGTRRACTSPRLERVAASSGTEAMVVVMPPVRPAI